jgi:hypothetical protein
MPLDTEFKSNPAEFLKTKVIVVPAATDAWYDTPGAYQFTLESGGANLVLLKPRIRITGDFIYAYYLPWESKKAPQMDLGARADFFFTSELTNCRFSVLADDPKAPKVAHIAGNLNKPARTNAEKEVFGTEASEKRVRRLSISGAFGSKASHDYGGGSVSSAFVFGQRDPGTEAWKFFAQVTKNCMAGISTVSADLTILRYATILT